MSGFIDDVGLEILQWLQDKRESVPGKGRSAREQLLDVVFFNNSDKTAIMEISEEIVILCDQIIEEQNE